MVAILEIQTARERPGARGIHKGSGEERNTNRCTMRTCDDTQLRASLNEPGNRANSVTGTNSVVCSWEISARPTGMNSRNTTKMVEHKLVLKKGETAVHCCDPALSVLVMLVSRNVFHIVSALQYIVFIVCDKSQPCKIL